MLHSHKGRTKTYCKTLAIANAATETVTFHDTSGIPILCNYINVACSGTVTHAGYLIVRPVGIYADSTVAVGAGTSGAGAVLGRVSDEITIILDGANSVSSVTISNFLASPSSATGVLVTYGVMVQAPNSLRGLAHSPGA